LLSAHPDGRPQGVQADAATRKWRHAYHEQVRRLLASAPALKNRAKKRLYRFMQQKLNMTADQLHAGDFDQPTARRATEVLSSIAWTDVDAWFYATHSEIA
jgi:hypothetical protein